MESRNGECVAITNWQWKKRTESSRSELIKKVILWFTESEEHDRIYTSYNEKENKDVYMVALRNDDGSTLKIF